MSKAAVLIQELFEARTILADANRYVAGLEADRSALKATVVAELMAGGMAATPADKAASQDNRMVDNATTSRAAVYERDLRYRDAEQSRFLVKLELLEIAAVVAD